MQQAIITLFRHAPFVPALVRGGSAPFPVRRLGGWLLVAALMGALGGCKAERDDMTTEYIQSKAYKTYHPAEIEGLSDGGSAIVSLSDGRPIPMRSGGNSSSGSQIGGHGLGGLRGAAPGDSQRVLDNPFGTPEDGGERTVSWTGAFDIYWKLNWARKELLSGNIPQSLQDVVVRTRKHSKRIAREGVHAPPDISYLIPAGLTIEEVLAPADSALKHLDEGLTLLKPMNEMEDAGIHTRFVPWSGGEDEARRYFERQGLLTPASHAPRFNADHFEDDDHTASALPASRPSTASISTRQQQAITLALAYARRYRVSPEDAARSEFESALRDTIRMRDLMKLQYHPPSISSNDSSIAGSLRQEAASLQSESPTQSKPFTDPFRRPDNVPLIR